MHPNLIYDIGAHVGEDTAYYLAKGFDVVAAEANPLLYKGLTERFAKEITAGRLTVLGVGVCDRSGTGTFYSNDKKEGWSSLLKETKATTRFTHVELEVELMPLSHILAAHGTPYYLKIDIEGAEFAAISTLDPAKPLPVFLSFEIYIDWQGIIGRLTMLGFDRFQLVRQGEEFLKPPPTPSREGAFVDIAFSGHHTGNFGRDLPQTWLTLTGLEAAMADLAEFKANYPRDLTKVWHDIHACRSDALAALQSDAPRSHG